MQVIELPEVNIDRDELKLLLAIKLFEEGKVSLGRAAEIAGYSTRTFTEILLKKGVTPIRYEDIDLEAEVANV